MEFVITQTLNGVSFGAIIFLLASGLSIIFGVMRTLNMAHGTFYLLGGYIGLSVILWTGNFYLSLLAGFFVIAGTAVAIERFFLRSLENKMLSQVLITIGVSYFVQDLCLVLWGGDPKWVKAPLYLTGSLNILGVTFPRYRLFIVALAVLVALGLWLLVERTRFGTMLRASVDDREMAQGVGIKFPIVAMGAFALGGGLAALSGIVGSAYLSVYPGIDLELLPYAFIVVIVGGRGSLLGAVVGSLLVGLIDNFGKALFPELAYFTLFASMAIIMVLRPKGLFGRSA
jgi:branched-chain amino acid transport system permease protein